KALRLVLRRSRKTSSMRDMRFGETQEVRCNEAKRQAILVFGNKTAIGNQRCPEAISLRGIEDSIGNLHLLEELGTRLLPAIDFFLNGLAFFQPHRRRSAAAGGRLPGNGIADVQLEAGNIRCDRG